MCFIKLCSICLEHSLKDRYCLGRDSENIWSCPKVQVKGLDHPWCVQNNHLFPTRKLSLLGLRRTRGECRTNPPNGDTIRELSIAFDNATPELAKLINLPTIVVLRRAEEDEGGDPNLHGREDVSALDLPSMDAQGVGFAGTLEEAPPRRTTRLRRKRLSCPMSCCRRRSR